MKWNVVMPEPTPEIQLVVSVEEAQLLRLLVGRCYTGNLPFDTMQLYNGLCDAVALATKQPRENIKAPFDIYCRKFSYELSDGKCGFVYDEQFNLGTKN